MKIFNKIGLISLILIPLLVVMTTAPTVIMAAEPAVKLGTTSTFAVLAGTTITNTGTTTINGSIGGNVHGNVGGDVGLSPGTDFTGKASVVVSGAVHLTNVVAAQAQVDLITAYDDAAGRSNVTIIPTELGGTTLIPGVYASDSGTFMITGKLTLDAQGDPNGVFIFKTVAELTTLVNSEVTLINSARFCRTFWKVGSSATLGVNSHFVGHILALTSIAAQTGATVQGQLLTRNGAVTLDSNTITNGYCATITAPITPTAPAILHVIKHVINDNGGKAIAANFKLHVKTSGSDIGVAPGVESPGTSYTLATGTYAVSEDTFTGYTASYSGDGDSNGNITLAPGDEKTIIITNNDIAPPPSINPGSGVEQPIVVTPTVPEVTVVTTTVTGGHLPNTSAHLYELLLIGISLTLVGALGWIIRKHYE